MSTGAFHTAAGTHDHGAEARTVSVLRRRVSSPPDLTWVVPEPGLHRAVRGNDIVGHVVVADGIFIAFDSRARPIGRFDSLRAAQRSATAGTASPQSFPPPRVLPAIATLARRLGIYARTSGDQ
ncbi:hypothetical protein [Microbacterium sp. P01]|uniref:hypothetical protein n=1 Tax=unclassified Microbacterium TaxID=2609290 RepID=UPI00366EDAB1